MSIYYNPHKLRARRWIITAFVSIPLVLTIIVYFVGKKKADEQSELKRQLEQHQEEIDLNKLL